MRSCSRDGTRPRNPHCARRYAEDPLCGRLADLAGAGCARGHLNMSNLHFHGLAVSPQRPQTNVLDMMTMPGESLDYTLVIPRNHLPGLNWYHALRTAKTPTVLDGMSGAFVIEGIERYAPEPRQFRVRVFVIRGMDISARSPCFGAARSSPGQLRGCGADHVEADLSIHRQRRRAP